MLVLACAGSGVGTTKETAVKSDQTDDFLNLGLIDLRNALAIDNLTQGFLELIWQLKVFVLQCESHFNQVIETELLSEAIIELSTLKLLEEKDEDFCETLWVVILDGEMVFTYETANETLDEEVHREGEVRAVILGNVGH